MQNKQCVTCNYNKKTLTLTYNEEGEIIDETWDIQDECTTCPHFTTAGGA